MNSLQPNEARAARAVLLIKIVLGLGIISLISDYFQYGLLQSIIAEEIVDESTAAANDLRQMVIGIVYIIAFIISAVTFIQWFRRAYANLHVKVKTLTHSEGWAAGSWFVPFINLYRPYKIMMELYGETDTLLKMKHDRYSRKISTAPVTWWWILWIISSIMGQASFRYSLKAETPEELIISTLLTMATSAIEIPLALITIKVIKDYAAVEPLLFTLRENSTADTADESA